ncbi:hypothetical protein [Propionivibrio sp.]|uniref:hypothetical protein n=1 Tax=Propionivibrio sp. TaxID=2212460 RepID=UPI0039E46967
MQTRTVTCDTRTFTAHELSVADMHTWYAGLCIPGGPCDVVDELALPDISLGDLARIYRCETKEFDSLVYRELEALAAAGREINPCFFRMRALVSETMQMLSEALSTGFPTIPDAEA